MKAAKAKIRMSQAGSRPASGDGEAGFTLFETLAVLTIFALLTVSVAGLIRPDRRSAVHVKSAAYQLASRLRDLRASAMWGHRETAAAFDAGRRVVHFQGVSGKPLTLGQSIALDVTTPAGEAISTQAAGIRFFPNGSSSGGTIRLQQGSERYEISVNWLTGRVSLAAIR